ncbi:hypothetical protein ACFQ60_47145 [Streptomyces zhihengii]
MLLLGEGAARREANRTPAPPLNGGRRRVESAGALQPQLVQMNCPKEQAPSQVDIGKDQMGRVDPAQRGDPHPGIGRVGQHLLIDRPPVKQGERRGLGGDSEGILEDRVIEVHGGVAQLQRGGR